MLNLGLSSLFALFIRQVVLDTWTNIEDFNLIINITIVITITLENLVWSMEMFFDGICDKKVAQ